jgi:hypothetical protein
VSEVYSTSGQYDLLMKCYLDEKSRHRSFRHQQDPDACRCEGHLHADHVQGLQLARSKRRSAASPFCWPKLNHVI